MKRMHCRNATDMVYLLSKMDPFQHDAYLYCVRQYQFNQH